MKKFLSSLFLAIIGLSIGLLLMELIVREFLPGPLVPRFVVDAGYGVRANKPNMVMHHFVPDEYNVQISNNGDGLRGTRDYSIEKPTTIHRIALIGDSFIWGFGVNDNEVLSTVMEQILNAGTSADTMQYEVLNFGVSGFGQAEELLTYRAKTRPYNADEVIIFYFDNDIGNNQVPNLFYLDDAGELQSTGKSYLPAVKTREMLDAFGPTNWIMTHSQTWNLIRNRLSSLIQRIKLKEKGLTSFSQIDEKGIALTKALLETMISEARQDGAHVTVVIIPQLNIKSNFPFGEEFITAAGATLIDGREFFKPEHYYSKDSHWRPSGHRLMAEILAKRILTSQ